MSITQLKSEQYGASSVKRSDLDTSGSGTAVIAKVIAGVNIDISSTGADSGTGDVTVSSLNVQSVATAAGTTTLTSSSPYQTIFTGTSTQTVVLPNATTLTTGERYVLSNNSTGLVTVNMNGGSLLWTIGANSDIYLVLTDNSTSAGTWDKDYRAGNAASGKTSTFNNSLTFSGTDGRSYIMDQFPTFGIENALRTGMIL